MMTGRRDTVARLVKRLVDDREVFGGFAVDGGAKPAIEQESVHHFEKRVDGAPLRRPWWFFDSRVQGSGAVDIPTHQVDQAQWLLDADAAPADAPALLAARGWSTRVPLAVFTRISRAGEVPSTPRATRSRGPRRSTWATRPTSPSSSTSCWAGSTRATGPPRSPPARSPSTRSWPRRPRPPRATKPRRADPPPHPPASRESKVQRSSGIIASRSGSKATP